MPTGRHHARRILEIDFTTDNSDNDIESIDALTFYRDPNERVDGNGISLSARAGAGEGGTQSALGTSLGSNEVWIELGEQQVDFSVIVLDQNTQA